MSIVALGLLGQRRTRAILAAGADHLRTFVFGDVSAQRRQFHHLMALHVALGLVARIAGLRQISPTVLAGFRVHNHGLVDPLWRHRGTVFAWVSLLTTGFAFALFAARIALLLGLFGPIRRGGLAGVSGVFAVGRQLALQIGNLLFPVGNCLVFVNNLLLELLVLPAQFVSFSLRALQTPPKLRPASQRTMGLINRLLFYPLRVDCLLCQGSDSHNPGKKFRLFLGGLNCYETSY